MRRACSHKSCAFLDHEVNDVDICSLVGLATPGVC